MRHVWRRGINNCLSNIRVYTVYPSGTWALPNDLHCIILNKIINYENVNSVFLVTSKYHGRCVYRLQGLSDIRLYIMKF